MEELTTFTENYLRLHLLEVKGGTPVLRCLLLKIVEQSSSKGDVDRYLAFFKDDIKLAKHPKSAEYQILYPSNGTTDINKWDISLLAYILIYCCTLDGQMRLKGKNTPKEILKKEVNSTIYKGDLDQFLKSESNKATIDGMKDKNIITDKQYDSLYQKTDINAWDIELLILVLFNLCHGDNLQKIRGICKDVVTREVQLCCDTRINLNVFLRKHERKFDVMRNHGTLTDSQHQQLFPSHGVSDLCNWDDTVLSLVVLNACQTLSPRTLNAVEQIRTLRRKLGAHPENTEIDNDTFRETWTDLHLAMHTIIITEVSEIEAEIRIATDTFKNGPLDLKSAIATLKEHDTKYISILSKLTAIESSLEKQLTSGFASTDRTIRQSEIDITQKMDKHHDTHVQLLQEINERLTELNRKLPEPAYSERREIKCFTVIFAVKGKSKEAVDEAENTIKKAMDGIDDKDTEKVKEVIELIKEILSKNDIKIEETRLGSISVVVKCLSVRGLHNLLNIVDSVELTDHLNKLSTVFAERTGCPILIDAYIPKSSLQTICEEIIKLDSSCDPPLISGNTSEKTIMDVDLPTTTPVTTPLTALDLPLMSGNTSENTIMDIDLPTTTPVTTPHTALVAKMPTTNTDFKLFNDPIHGSIEIPKLCVKIMDTPEFQRLRSIKQLGIVSYVYPGAVHTRFDHSIGVCHIAGQLIKSLKEHQPDLNITDTDVKCVEIAGLCHDLGFGPFSHMFEEKVIPRMLASNGHTHDDYSRMVFDHLVEKNELIAAFEDDGLTYEHREAIKDFITGRRPASQAVGIFQGKDFLYEIVSNKETGIDVDKWDCFARDCLMLGFHNNFDYNRCIQLTKVLNVDGRSRICFRDKSATDLYDMFYTGLTLHRRAYKHKVVQIVEYMMTNAMVKALDTDVITFSGNGGEKLTLKQAIQGGDMTAYCQMTDYIIDRIRYSDSKNIAIKEAQGILRDIDTRKMCILAGQKRLNPNQIIKKRYLQEISDEIEQAILALVNQRRRHPQLYQGSIMIDIVEFDYGKTANKNPIDNVWFYEKRTDRPTCLPKEKVSHMMPDIYQEQLVRVFCKEKEDAKDVSFAFDEWCNSYYSMA